MIHIIMTGKAALNLFQLLSELVIILNRNNKWEESKKITLTRLIKSFKKCH